MHETHACNLCGDEAKLICSGCNLVTYCHADHQRVDWRDHRVVCHAKIGTGQADGTMPSTIGDELGEDEQRGLINAIIRAAYYVGETVSRAIKTRILEMDGTALFDFVETVKQMVALSATGSIEFVCAMASKLPEFVAFISSLLGDVVAPDDPNRGSVDYSNAKAAARMCRDLFSRASTIARWMIDLVRQAGLIMLQGLRGLVDKFADVASTLVSALSDVVVWFAVKAPEATRNAVTESLLPAVFFAAEVPTITATLASGGWGVLTDFVRAASIRLMGHIRTFWNRWAFSIEFQDKIEKILATNKRMQALFAGSVVVIGQSAKWQLPKFLAQPVKFILDRLTSMLTSAGMLLMSSVGTKFYTWATESEKNPTPHQVISLAKHAAVAVHEISTPQMLEQNRADFVQIQEAMKSIARVDHTVAGRQKEKIKELGFGAYSIKLTKLSWAVSVQGSHVVMGRKLDPDRTQANSLKRLRGEADDNDIDTQLTSAIYLLSAFRRIIERMDKEQAVSSPIDVIKTSWRAFFGLPALPQDPRDVDKKDRDILVRSLHRKAVVYGISDNYTVDDTTNMTEITQTTKNLKAKLNANWKDAPLWFWVTLSTLLGSVLACAYFSETPYDVVGAHTKILAADAFELYASRKLQEYFVQSAATAAKFVKDSMAAPDGKSAFKAELFSNPISAGVWERFYYGPAMAARDADVSQKAAQAGEMAYNKVIAPSGMWSKSVPVSADLVKQAEAIKDATVAEFKANADAELYNTNGELRIEKLGPYYTVPIELANIHNNINNDGDLEPMQVQSVIRDKTFVSSLYMDSGIRTPLSLGQMKIEGVTVEQENLANRLSNEALANLRPGYSSEVRESLGNYVARQVEGDKLTIECTHAEAAAFDKEMAKVRGGGGRFESGLKFIAAVTSYSTEEITQTSVKPLSLTSPMDSSKLIKDDPFPERHFQLQATDLSAPPQGSSSANANDKVVLAEKSGKSVSKWSGFSVKTYYAKESKAENGRVSTVLRSKDALALRDDHGDAADVTTRTLFHVGAPQQEEARGYVIAGVKIMDSLLISPWKNMVQKLSHWFLVWSPIVDMAAGDIAKEMEKTGNEIAKQRSGEKDAPKIDESSAWGLWTQNFLRQLVRNAVAFIGIVTGKWIHMTTITAVVFITKAFYWLCASVAFYALVMFLWQLYAAVTLRRAMERSGRQQFAFWITDLVYVSDDYLSILVVEWGPLILPAVGARFLVGFASEIATGLLIVAAGVATTFFALKVIQIGIKSANPLT